MLYQKRPQRRSWWSHQNLRRSLLIQRLEGSRPVVGSDVGGYGFSINVDDWHEIGDGPVCLVEEEEYALETVMEVENDRGWNRFWVKDKDFFRRQGARRGIEPKDGSRFAVLGNWFHAATPAIEGGERSWIWAAVSLSMTTMGPPHLGQSQSGLGSRAGEISGSVCDGCTAPSS